MKRMSCNDYSTKHLNLFGSTILILMTKSQIRSYRVTQLAVLMILILLTAGCRKNNPWYHYKDATAKYQLGDFMGAVAGYTRAIELNPGFTEAYYSRAICQSRLGSYDQALNDFNKVSELDPTHADAIFNRAFYVKEKTGDFEGAIEDYNRFLELRNEEEHPYALNNRGYARFRLGDLQAAIKDINQSLDIDPANAYAFRNRALVYLQMGMDSLACLDLKKATDLGYENLYGEDVREMLIRHCGE